MQQFEHMYSEDTKMPQTGVNFINRKGTKVLAYSDTVIFYNGKGNGKIESQDKIDSSSEKAPFGLIKTGNTQPFQVEFDLTNPVDPVVYLNPGMLSVYGRQVQLKEKIKVHGFHQDLLASDNYCTLYIEINLSDILNQTARVVLTSSANGYEYDYGVNGSNRDNLYKYNNGIYRVPIAQFKFRPMDSNPFSDLKYLIQDFDMSARESTRNLREDATIIGRKIIGDLAKKELHPYEDDLRFLVKADNQEALNSYENEKEHNKNSAGYSWAKESRSFGGVRIGSDLSNLITIKRQKILNLQSSFATGSMIPKSVYCAIDWNHLVGIRLFFDSSAAKAKAKVGYRAKAVTTLGIPVESTIDAQMTFLDSDYFPLIDGEKAQLALYGSYTAKSVGYLQKVELLIQDRPQEYNGERGDYWDKCLNLIWGNSTGVDHTNHPFMFITIQGNLFTFRTFGQSKEHDYGTTEDHIWYIYKDLEITNAAGALYADFIYQGDVDI